VLLVLALIPLLAACSFFSKSEPPATLVETPTGTETAAGSADSTAPESGAPTEAGSGTSTSLATIPTAAGTTPASAAPTTPALAATPAPASTASVPAAKTPEPAPYTPTSNGANIAGRWTGTWVGTGLFNAPRQENVTLELAQKGDAGYGRLVLDGATAAESVPWEVRQQGLGGIRVFASVNGSKVRLTHELDDRFFTANLTVLGDQMVGEIKGNRKIRLLLARQNGASNAPAREVPPQAAQVVPPPRSEEFVKVPELKPLYFDFDKSILRPDAVDALSSNLTWLRENADTFVLIEGNADERGTAEYNLALGDRRAKSALDYLEANGIAKERMSTISNGKERPICVEATEACRAQNRRADFRIKSR